MTKRQQTLELIRIAAADGDERHAMRLYVENPRVGRDAFEMALMAGRKQRGAA